MKIINLKASNIKKLVAVDITPTGDVIKISGKNGAGKTSVLDSIFWALGGNKGIQDEPLRRGEAKGSIELDLGDIIVKRTFNESGATTLVLENKDGLRFQSPQNMLDSLLGRLTFDPLEFMRQDPKKQFATLRQLTGVNTDRLDGIRQKAYDERTQVNAMVKRLEVQAEAIVVPAGTPKEEVNVAQVAELLREASAIKDQKTANDAKINELQQKLESGKSTFRMKYENQQNQCAEIKAKIDQLNKELKEKEAFMEDGSIKFANWEIELDDDIKKVKELANSIVVPDIDGLQAQLGQAQTTNKAVAQYQKREELRREAVTTKKLADDLTQKIETVDAEKNQMIAEAKFPLEGLGFGAGVVTYKDLPLEQASSAEQLRVSMAMAMALNPKIRVIRITDGSLLDPQSMAEVEAMAKDNDFQVWAELVDVSGKVGIFIEDGAVAAVNP
jgi:DNA repair exonuclease SbcCD ATPase subunit